MIFIPVTSNVETQFLMVDWAKKHLGEPSPDTWFWAKHTMEYHCRDDFSDVSLAIVFKRDEDAIAFKLRFEL